MSRAVKSVKEQLSQEGTTEKANTLNDSLKIHTTGGFTNQIV